MAESLIQSLIAQAYLARNSIMFIISSICLMLLCSLAIGVTHFFSKLSFLPVILFILGVVSMLIGVVIMFVEVSRGLSEIEFEHERLENLKF